MHNSRSTGRLHFLIKKAAFCLLFGCFPIFYAAAQTNVIVGGSASYPPFHYLGSQDNATGFDIELVKQIGAISGWQIQFILGDWEETQKALSSGEIDIVPMFVSEERSQLYLFSDSIGVEYHLLFGMVDSAVYDGIDSLAGLRIAAERGAFATREIARLNAYSGHSDHPFRFYSITGSA